MYAVLQSAYQDELQTQRDDGRNTVGGTPKYSPRPQRFVCTQIDRILLTLNS